MFVATRWVSDIYYLSPMCYVYIEVRMTACNRVFFIICYCNFLYDGQ